jgi:hypothetical protein
MTAAEINEGAPPPALVDAIATAWFGSHWDESRGAKHTERQATIAAKAALAYLAALPAPASGGAEFSARLLLERWIGWLDKRDDIVLSRIEEATIEWLGRHIDVSEPPPAPASGGAVACEHDFSLRLTSGALTCAKCGIWADAVPDEPSAVQMHDNLDGTQTCKVCGYTSAAEMREAELEDLITERNIEAGLMAAEHTRLTGFLRRIADSPWSKEDPVSIAREALALRALPLTEPGSGD